jgi:predicted MPP superfamily phosphohydrolase
VGNSRIGHRSATWTAPLSKLEDDSYVSERGQLNPKRSSIRRGVELASVLGAGLCSSVYLVNREVLFWPERTQQTLGILGLALAVIVACSACSIGRWGARLSRVAALVLLLFAASEVRRVWLRHQYRASVAEAGSVESFRLDTTLDLRVQHYEVKANARAGRRVRIIQVTDLHVTGELPYSYYQGLTEKLRARNPDVIALTGDLLSRHERLPLLRAWLETLPPTRLGAYAVLGNHEYWAHADSEVREALTASRVQLLAGDCRALPPTEPLFRLCGTESPWGPELRANALEHDAQLPFVTLSHTPDNVYSLAELGALAVLAGHTHGGQLRVPLLGAIIVPSRFGRRFDVGHFKVGETHLFVSAGVGADAPPLRAFCPPELVEVDLAL